MFKKIEKNIISFDFRVREQQQRGSAELDHISRGCYLASALYTSTLF